VYAKVFEQIDEEENVVDDEDEEEKGPKTKSPSFGDSKTPYSEVRKFYNYWSHFISRRSFAFADKYKLSTVSPHLPVRLRSTGTQPQSEAVDGTRQ